MSVLESCLKVFRENIFMLNRLDINQKMNAVLLQELDKSITSKMEDKDIYTLGEKISKSCQVLVEFMDKGIKGLLSGDLSIYVVQKI